MKKEYEAKVYFAECVMSLAFRRDQAHIAESFKEFHDALQSLSHSVQLVTSVTERDANNKPSKMMFSFLFKSALPQREIWMRLAGGDKVPFGDAKSRDDIKGSPLCRHDTLTLIEASGRLYTTASQGAASWVQQHYDS